MAQEILEDLESNLTTLQIIASAGEKLELEIAGKLENLEQIKACIEAVKKLKDELLDILKEVELLDLEMRKRTRQQLKNIEIIYKYLSSAYEGKSRVDIQVFKNDQFYDRIRLMLG